MQYQKLTHHEHVLKRGEVYAGSFQETTIETIVYRPCKEVARLSSDSGIDTPDEMSIDSTNDNVSPLQFTKVAYIPAFLKIFDEIICNASDQKIREPEATKEIRVKINQETGEIEVFNDGKGIPVVIHDKEECYVPEMIFGQLLSGSNFDDTQTRNVSGLNGIGASLCNIYSKTFTVETADTDNDKLFRCTWSDNMYKKGKVHVGPIKGRGKKKGYTRVTFTPDYERFKLTKLDDDHYGLMARRVYDLAATLCGTVKIYLNDKLVPVKSIDDFTKMCIPVDMHDTILSDHSSDGRWHVAVVPSPNGAKHQQMTFVNGVHTLRGGSHANDVTNKIIEGLRKVVKETQLGDTALKNQFWLFMTCTVDNPTFDTQTKEKLTLKASSWGSTWTPAPKFLKKLASGPISEAIALAIENANNKLAKKSDGVRRSKITGIRKLVDATMAGTAQSAKCTLFLTEGDSAKSTAIAGLSALPEKDRRYFGVYPLRGKLLNVRDAPTKAVLENKEITELKKILGLQVGKVYKNTSELRYGRVALFTDADTDGSHIKGLIMNLLEHNWPSLLELPGFLCEFITPIVKCTRASGSAKDKGKVMSFFSQQEFRQWNNGEVPAGWKVKYYKGLGTSTKDEAQGYFKELDRHMCSFHELSKEDREALDLAFRKTRAADRKQWLAEYNAEEYLNRKVAQKNRISEFIDKDLIHFSNYDNVRNIPKMIDGLKPSQRKVIWTMLQKRITNDIKVAQLGAIVAEYTGYHHGEVSLFQTIINMAQDFVGSNNLNLLVPSGQFGSRLLGGSDASAPRYIYTRLQDFTRALFPVEDDMILNKQVDDGQVIEPEYLLPILPLVLINGATGIGTGYSTDVPQYRPSAVLEAIRSRLQGSSGNQLVPWYRGFTGTVTTEDDGKYTVSGLWEVPNPTTVVIKELPVGTWTENYIENTLDPLEEKGTIASVTKRFTDTDIDIQLKVPAGGDTQALIDKLKLSTTVRTSNMVLFDAKGHIKRYPTVDTVIDDYMVVRLDGYCRRKAAQLEALRGEILILDNRVRFIHSCINGSVVLGKTKLEEVEKKLSDMRFARIKEGYEYLHGMSLSSLTAERAAALEEQLKSKQTQYKDLEGRTPQQLWLSDLEKLSGYLTKLGL